MNGERHVEMPVDPLRELQRQHDFERRWRRRLCLILSFGRHFYPREWDTVSIHPVGVPDDTPPEDGFILGYLRQCRLCYECERKDAGHTGTLCTCEDPGGPCCEYPGAGR